MDRTEALGRLTRAPVGHLATTTPRGRPHVVPVTFAVLNRSVVTMVDHKPKTTPDLKRLENVRKGSRASLIVDHYDDDWEKLWWVRVDGPATVHESGELWSASRLALADKYRQYRHRMPDGPAIQVEIERINYWESTG